jgi:16S rRNA (guanine(966)-N(2))-methyltransferase RsmD
MRIIAGIYKGFPLKSFPGMDIRPTPAKVREAVFDILGFKIIDSDFLDLFAGTGAIGIEALSRGAKRATFVDINPNAVNLIKANLSKIKQNDFSDVIKRDYMYSLKMLKLQQRKFDIIFFDPPYYKNISKKVLNEIEKNNILKKNTTVIVQHNTYEEVHAEHQKLSFLKEKKYGKSKITLFTNI